MVEWYELSKAGKLPKDIPASPQAVYQYDGWAGLSDWLGNGKKFKTFTQARAYVRSLKINSVQWWKHRSYWGLVWIRNN